MGYELRRQLRDVLGPQITGLQRAVALEIADDANEATRKSVAQLEDLARWTGAKDTSVVRNALKRLATSGWEFRVPIGKGKDGRPLYAVPGMRMTFLVPPFEGGATATPSGVKGEPRLPLGGAPATPSEPAADEGEIPGQGPILGTNGQTEGGATATPMGAEGGAPAPPFSKEQTSTTYKDSSPVEGGATATPSRAGVDHHLEAFGAFWIVYPKKRAREEAKKAWCAAIERGANPERIVAAATAYARERAGEDPKFTKYPATWLNKGCYDDEPDTIPGTRPPLRAVAGSGWQPYTNPTDHSVYQNGWT